MLKMMESVLLGLSEMEMNDLLTTYKYVCYVTHLMVIGKFFYLFLILRGYFDRIYGLVKVVFHARF